MKLYIFSNRRMLNNIYLFLGCELCVRVVGCELFWSRLAGNSTALLPIIAGYQLSPPENKTFIFQQWFIYFESFLSCICSIHFGNSFTLFAKLGMLLW